MDTLNDMIGKTPENQPNESGPSDAEAFGGFDFGTSQNAEVGPSDIMNNMNDIPLNQNQDMNMEEPCDEEEVQRREAREKEQMERKRKIEDKINLELKQKNQIREEAKAYMDEFEAKRKSNLEKRKQQNLANEKEFLNNKKLIKEGKKNPWEIVCDNIALRESDYKGSNDVNRMRSAIIARKNDQNSAENKIGSFI